MVQDEKELDMPREWWEDECCPDDAVAYVRDAAPDETVLPDSHVVRYENHVPAHMLNRTYSDEEKKWLRPICETLAMLQWNAFFGVGLLDGTDWYEQWLPEAATIFYGNGGPTGWAGEMSWMKDLTHESENVEHAWKAWKALKSLSQPD
jgi:hypothetical protein